MGPYSGLSERVSFSVSPLWKEAAVLRAECERLRRGITVSRYLPLLPSSLARFLRSRPLSRAHPRAHLRSRAELCAHADHSCSGVKPPVRFAGGAGRRRPSPTPPGRPRRRRERCTRSLLATASHRRRSACRRRALARCAPRRSAWRGRAPCSASANADGNHACEPCLTMSKASPLLCAVERAVAFVSGTAQNRSGAGRRGLGTATQSPSTLGTRCLAEYLLARVG